MILATKAAVAHSGAAGLPYQWVTAGANGYLYTSTTTDGSSWTSQTSSFGSDVIYGVASDGVSQYVAVGAAGKLATSPDGITWTQRTSSFGGDTILGISYGDGYWVAVGDAGKVATSTDGITWTQRTSGTPNQISSVAYGNGLFALGGSGGYLATAPDPTSTWTSRTSTLGQRVYLYYAPDQAIWVAWGDPGTSGAFASSTDGTTWTSRNSAVSLPAPNVLTRGGFSSTASVIAFGSTISFIGPTCDVQSSTNGTTWTNRTPGTSSDRIAGMAVDDAGNFIVCSDVIGGSFQSSTNGTSWTDQGGVTGRGFYAICHSSGTPSIR
jgi:hypothetical protein